MAQRHADAVRLGVALDTESMQHCVDAHVGGHFGRFNRVFHEQLMLIWFVLTRPAHFFDHECLNGGRPSGRPTDLYEQCPRLRVSQPVDRPRRPLGFHEFRQAK